MAIETPASQADINAEQEAQELIDRVMKQHLQGGGEVTPEQLAAFLRAEAANRSKEVQERVEAYIGTLTASVRTDVIKALEHGVGGQYDGTKTYMAAAVIVPVKGEKVEEQATEISNHEQYHKDHDHLADIKAAEDAVEDGGVAVIGGETFDDTEVVEPMTMERTGTEFVSGGYRDMHNRMGAALSRAKLGWSDLEKAIDARDLSIISDGTREKAKGVVEGQYALAA
ncbi:hypothetical protein FJZ28_02685 [Candidatus Peregrinibacteria bacterium]|nr:hypothetical protein [Candidatus Peregrinibacteria bacterium]